ncbi:MAG: hypothetical protein WDN67_04130 [Candidatus Moraniibacteriota bacterium]
MGLMTDASYRYERGLDPNLPGEVAPLAAELFTGVSGGKLLGLRDLYLKKPLARRIKLDLLRVEQVLGEKVPLFEGGEAPCPSGSQSEKEGVSCRARGDGANAPARSARRMGSD